MEVAAATFTKPTLCFPPLGVRRSLPFSRVTKASLPYADVTQRCTVNLKKNVWRHEVVRSRTFKLVRSLGLVDAAVKPALCTHHNSGEAAIARSTCIAATDPLRRSNHYGVVVVVRSTWPNKTCHGPLRLGRRTGDSPIYSVASLDSAQQCMPHSSSHHCVHYYCITEVHAVRMTASELALAVCATGQCLVRFYPRRAMVLIGGTVRRDDPPPNNEGWIGPFSGRSRCPPRTRSCSGTVVPEILV